MSWIIKYVEIEVHWTVLFKTCDGTKLNKTLLALTAVKFATSWTEIFYVEDKSNANISRIFEDHSLRFYPSPEKVVH